MKNLMLTLLMAMTLNAALAGAAQAGNCDHSWQTASDGSSCGGRAASERPGGR